MKLQIDNDFINACRRLNESELRQLEDNILKDGEIFTPLITWNGFILDGHHRYEIAKKHNLEVKTEEMKFDSKDEAIIWILDHQYGSRNLTDFEMFENRNKKKEYLLKKGKEKQIESGRKYGEKHPQEVLSENDKTSHNTRQEIADELGWSTGKIAMADVIQKEALEETKNELRQGKKSITGVYTELKKTEAKISIEVDILESFANSLERLINKHAMDKPLFPFLKNIQILINKIREEKIKYAKGDNI